jgi:hypothetical protein
MKYSLFILILMVSTPAFSALKIKAKCSLNYSDDQYSFDGKYFIIRDGDSLYSEYRHQADEEMTASDNVIYKYYTDDDLSDYNNSGMVDLLCEVAGNSCKYLSAISYYEIKEPRGEAIEMRLWKLEGLWGWDIAYIASGGDFYATCD